MISDFQESETNPLKSEPVTALVDVTGFVCV